jgi:tRNA(adenine34) deaminase
MDEAFKMALLAYSNDEVPVGAVVVKDNVIIGKGCNQVIANHSVSSHAEINAINDASLNLKNYRLNNCDIYVTLEPCHMCAKAIVDARMNHLYFGAIEPKTGAIQSIDRFLDRHHLNHKVSYSEDYIMKEISAALLQKFFRSRRT